MQSENCWHLLQFVACIQSYGNAMDRPVCWELNQDFSLAYESTRRTFEKPLS